MLQHGQDVTSRKELPLPIALEGTLLPQGVWDTGTLAWVKMTQPGGGSGGGGAATIADGADVVQGATADAAIDSDVAGTISGKLRGLVKILASVWDSGAGRLKVDGSAVTQPVSGTFWQATQPVSGPLTDAQLRAAVVPVSITGAATAANQTTGNASLTSIDGKLPALDAGRIPVVLPPGGSGLTDTELRATAVPVSGPLTDGQLRATPVPVSGTVAVNVGLTDAQLRASAVPVSGPLTDAQLRAAAVPVSGGADHVLTFAGDKVDASGSTVTANAGTNLNTSLLGLETTLVGRLKPADTLAAVTNLVQLNGQAVAMGTGTRSAGTQRVTVATDDVVPVVGPTLTKGTQGSTGLSVQQLNNAGRNQTNFFMAAPIITTVAEVMMSLTGYKSGAAVGATVTPAVVTAGKTLRITTIIITYFNVATVGSARFTLRANLSGVGVIGSPLVWSTQLGISGDGASTAGHSTTVTRTFPEGMEFAAGTGIALGMQGFGAVPTTGTIVGYGKVEILGYEY